MIGNFESILNDVNCFQQIWHEDYSTHTYLIVPRVTCNLLSITLYDYPFSRYVVGVPVDSQVKISKRHIFLDLGQVPTKTIAYSRTWLPTSHIVWVKTDTNYRSSVINIFLSIWRCDEKYLKVPYIFNIDNPKNYNIAPPIRIFTMNFDESRLKSVGGGGLWKF